jgi:two-component system chemotaxis response regulator CheB
MAAAAIRVLVVDDDRFVQALTALLSGPRFDLVGVARNGEEGVQQALLLRPDIVTMDIDMPALDGVAATKRLLESQPRRRPLGVLARL